MSKARHVACAAILKKLYPAAESLDDLLNMGEKAVNDLSKFKEIVIKRIDNVAMSKEVLTTCNLEYLAALDG